MDNEQDPLNGGEDDNTRENKDDNPVYVVKERSYISQEDILKMFGSDSNKRMLEIRNHALKIIAEENEKCSLSDVEVIIIDLSKSTRKWTIKHGTGQQRLIIHVEGGKSSSSWENKCLKENSLIKDTSEIEESNNGIKGKLMAFGKDVYELLSFVEKCLSIISKVMELIGKIGTLF